MSAAASIAPEPAITERVVLLIDLSSLFWAAWHSSGEDEISQARRRTLEAVQRCIGDDYHRLVAICCDSGRSFRKDLLPEYKANRPEKDHSSLAELDRVKAKLIEDGFLLWEAPTFEADDVIATAAQRAAMAGHRVVVASADKDLLQLLAYTTVTALRTHNFSKVSADDVVEKFGIFPDQLGDFLALVGDASDNIRGAPGVGPKTAAALLKKYTDLDSLWAALAKDPGSVATPAVVRSLQQNADAVKLARQLVTLRFDAPIDFAQLYETRKPKASAKREIANMDTPDAQFTDDVPISPGPGAATAPQTSLPLSAAPPTSPPPAPPIAMPPPAAQPPQAPPSASSTALSTAVVPQVMAPGSYELALEPTSLGVAMNMAAALYDSRLYTRFPSPEAILAVIVRGREMGLGALTALDAFHIIEGKPSPHAHLIVALAERDPECEYFALVSSDATQATYETKKRRNPKPQSMTYTIQQAVDAGLCNIELAPRTAKPGEKDARGPWDKRRAEMLRKTSAVQLVRAVYPNCALGLYSVEEMGGDV